MKKLLIILAILLVVGTVWAGEGYFLEDPCETAKRVDMQGTAWTYQWRCERVEPKEKSCRWEFKIKPFGFGNKIKNDFDIGDWEPFAITRDGNYEDSTSWVHIWLKRKVCE